MSLRRALATLPDDLATRNSARSVVAYLQSHEGERFDVERIGRGTGVSLPRVESVLCALASGYVVDCDGDPRSTQCIFSPDPVLSLEVRRYLRVAGGSDARLQRGVDRFRGRYGSGA